ncbi:MAG: hypothetical protein WCC03_20095 [Candidatus Acidiferrales bacterium]
MSGLKRFAVPAIVGVALSCIAIPLCASPLVAQSNDNNFLLVLASGFLCDPGDASTCPATARSNQGDSYELSGAGTLDVQGKSVRAAGSYTHRSPTGNVLETGVWLAGELVSFNSYGAAPNSLPRQGRRSGPALLALKRLPMHSGPVPTGGLAILRIRLTPLQGRSRNAVLQVNCALGDVPRERSVQGIRLSIEGDANDFSEEASGHVMFLSTRPEVSAAVKAPPQETTQDAGELPKN